MGRTAAEVCTETIHDWGVEVIFGLPGAGMHSVMEALHTRSCQKLCSGIALGRHACSFTVYGSA